MYDGHRLCTPRLSRAINDSLQIRAEEGPLHPPGFPPDDPCGPKLSSCVPPCASLLTMIQGLCVVCFFIVCSVCTNMFDNCSLSSTVTCGT